MRAARRDRALGLVFGLGLLLVFAVPFALIGPRDVCGMIWDLFSSEPEWEGGRVAGLVLLAFVLAVPLTGAFLFAGAVAGLGRRRGG
jgi:hypothetical protein